MSWRAVLEAADVVVMPSTPSEVVVELASGARQRLHLVRSSGTLHPSVMQRTDAARPNRPEGLRRLWVAAAASPAAVLYARHAGDSLVTADGQVLLQVDGQTLEVGRPAPRAAPRPRGRTPWGVLGVARRMLEVDVDRQQDLAGLAGLSQERVSRLLSRLRDHGLTARTAGTGGRAVERPVSAAALLDWWLEEYPREEALRAHYFAPDPLPAQLARAAAALTGRRPLLSGDLAADQLAPWRRPGLVLLYCTRPVDLTGAGFVAASAAQATLTVVTSPDPTVAIPTTATGQVWAQAPAGDGVIELADPFQVLLDVLGSPAPDASQAAGRLRDALLTGRTHDHVRTWLEHIVQQHPVQQSGTVGAEGPR